MTLEHHSFARSYTNAPYSERASIVHGKRPSGRHRCECQSGEYVFRRNSHCASSTTLSCLKTSHLLRCKTLENWSFYRLEKYKFRIMRLTCQPPTFLSTDDKRSVVFVLYAWYICLIFGKSGLDDHMFRKVSYTYGNQSSSGVTIGEVDRNPTVHMDPKNCVASI